MKARTSRQLAMGEKFTHGIPDLPWEIFQNTQDGLQLIFSKHNVATDLPQAVNGIQTNALDLVVKHVDEEIEGQASKVGMLLSQFTQRVNRGRTNLVIRRKFLFGLRLYLKRVKTLWCSNKVKTDKLLSGLYLF